MTKFIRIHAYSVRVLKYEYTLATQRDPMTPEEIRDLVCRYTKISFEMMTKKRRTRELVEARQMLIYLLCTNSTLSLKAIGEFMSPGRVKPMDHTTVIHSRETIKGLMDVDSTMASRMRRLSSIISRNDDNITIKDTVDLTDIPNPQNNEDNVRTIDRTKDLS